MVMKPNSGEKYSIYRAKFLDKFECLGADCEDTCCKGWGMQLDPPHKKLYEEKAPELLDAVTSGEDELIMRRDPKTDYCVKFDNGLCGIHKKYGSEFLGDACHFYPRATRQLGDDNAFMTATVSCPEVARLVLFGDAPFEVEKVETDRVPYSITDYLPEELSAEQALAIAKAFTDTAGDASITPERAMMRIFSVSLSLQHMKKEQWPEAVPFYLRSADARLLPPEKHNADPYRLLHGLCGLITSSKKTSRPRLDETIQAMEKALNVTMNWQTLEIINNGQDMSAYTELKTKWRQGADKAMAAILHRLLQNQIVLSFYPFAGLGNDWVERATIMGVRLATLKLALMCHMDEEGNPPDEATIVRVVQSIARFMDHLVDPTLSMAFYRDAGWTKDTRMRGLLEDA